MESGSMDTRYLPQRNNNNSHPVPEAIRNDRFQAANWWVGKRIVKKVQCAALLSRY